MNHLAAYKPDSVYCEDARPGLKEILDGSVQLILTDVPYGQGYVSNRGKNGPTDPIEGDLTFDQALGLWVDLLPEFYRVLAPWGVLITTAPFGNGALLNQTNCFSLAMAEAGFARPHDYAVDYVWDKGHWTTGDLKMGPMRQAEIVLVATKGERSYAWHAEKRAGNVLRYTRPMGKDAGLHPSQKPVQLGEDLIEWYSQPGDLVLDPMCGSGSFLVAAQTMGRSYLGMDISKRNVVISLGRLTGTLPEVLADMDSEQVDEDRQGVLV
ncbi:hypothetical protein KQI63_15755 [bacterium]|nr:hypothetical protein [bacterium]